MQKLTMTALAALALTLSTPAGADPQEIQLSTTVRFADLNLDSPEAIETVYRRLSHAASVVCEPLEGRALWRISKHRQCVSEAMSNAVAEMNRPLLTQLHHHRTGVTTPHLAAR